jgi:hypothetical protein
VVLNKQDFTPELTLNSERAQRRLARLAGELMDFGRRRRLSITE